MSKEDVASFVDLDVRKKLIESKMAAMRAEMQMMGELLRGINREQDAWLVCFAARNEVLEDVSDMTFDITRAIAVVE